MLTLKVVNAIFDSLAKKMAIKGNYVAISCFCLTCSFLTSYLCLCFAFFFFKCVSGKGGVFCQTQRYNYLTCGM